MTNDQLVEYIKKIGGDIRMGGVRVMFELELVKMVGEDATDELIY